MYPKSLLTLLVLGLLFVSSHSGFSEETVTVKYSAFGVPLRIKGLVVPVEAATVSLERKSSASFTVKQVVPHGATVKQGETLVSFDTTRIDDDIRKKKASLAQVSIEFTQLQQEIEHLKKVQEIRQQVAHSRLSQLQADQKAFKEKLEPTKKEIAQNEVTKLEQALAYAEEELKQLELMYGEDQITEESEEIVLTRQKNRVDQFAFLLRTTKVMVDDKLNNAIPKEGKKIADELAIQHLKSAKLSLELPAEIMAKEAELAVKLIAKELAEQSLSDLETDHTLLEVSATADGIVYYGEFRDGKWYTEDARRSLQKGGVIRPDRVFMTIVDPRSVCIEASVGGRFYHALKKGLKGRAVAEATGDGHFAILVDEVTAVPTHSGSYRARFAFEKSDQLPLPGIKIMAMFTAFPLDETIVLPRKVVHEDPLNEFRPYVWIDAGEGKGNKQQVTLGPRSDKKVVVTDGLAVGVKVLVEAPEEK